MVALLKEAGAPVGPRTLIEGESLLNDASAFVIFEVLLSVLESGASEIPISHSVGTAARLSIGGLGVGLFCGFVCAVLLTTTSDPVLEISIALAPCPPPPPSLGLHHHPCPIPRPAPPPHPYP